MACFGRCLHHLQSHHPNTHYPNQIGITIQDSFGSFVFLFVMLIGIFYFMDIVCPGKTAAKPSWIKRCGVCFVVALITSFILLVHGADSGELGGSVAVVGRWRLLWI